MSPVMPRQGLLLFAHGARDPRWADPFRAVARRIEAQQPAIAVDLAFLEFMEPDLPTAAARLASAGCTVVDIVPLFLGAGGHVRKDLPVLVARLGHEHAGVRWRLQAAVGESPRVIEAMAQAALDAAGGVAPGAAGPMGQSAASPGRAMP
jgi:sirohydrochlorin cobaltochelatase